MRKAYFFKFPQQGLPHASQLVLFGRLAPILFAPDHSVLDLDDNYLKYRLGVEPCGCDDHGLELVYPSIRYYLWMPANVTGLDLRTLCETSTLVDIGLADPVEMVMVNSPSITLTAIDAESTLELVITTQGKVQPRDASRSLSRILSDLARHQSECYFAQLPLTCSRRLWRNGGATSISHSCS